MKFKLDEKFLEKYLNSTSPTGFEYELGGQKVWMDHMESLGAVVELDTYGSAVAMMGNMHSAFRVVIEAHADEISWLVNYIDPKGYIKVIRNGGSDTLIAPSMRVNLWGEKGKVKGIFGHPAIHIHERNEKADLNSIFIDVGAKDKKAVEEMGIQIGTVVTFQDEFMKLGLDKRIGPVDLIKQSCIGIPDG